MANLEQIDLCQPNPSTIEMLETALAHAKEGEVVGFIGVKMHRDGQVSVMWQDPDVGRTALRNDNVIGALERLKFKVLCGRYDVDTEDMLFEEDGDGY